MWEYYLALSEAGFATGLVQDQQIEAVLSLGMLAEQSVRLWQEQSDTGTAFSGVVATMRHPTYPESASASGQVTHAEAMARMLTTWNAALSYWK